MTTQSSEKANWRTLAQGVRWRIQPFIEGAYRASAADESWIKINPTNEQSLYATSIGSTRDLEDAVRSARRRFEEGSWSERSAGERAAVLRRLANLLTRQRAELSLLDTLEMGKPIQASLHDAGVFAPSILRSCADFAERLTGSAVPISSTMLAINTWEPRGVVGAVTPWNFPIVNAVIKVAPALAAGNTVVLKPSELSPSSALRFAELALEAGLPAGAFNVVPGLGATVGAALASHPNVDLLSFTGSTTTGRKIMELCGHSNGKPVMLECGGKSPQVVFEDVDDLDRVAQAAVQSFLWNSGQVCSAHTRLVVQESIKNRLMDEIVRRAREVEPDDPLDETTTFGPLASPAQRDRVKRYIDRGIQDGAEAVLKGAIRESGGCQVAPTIFDRVTPEMAIAREEIFGPVLSVQSFRTEAEAIALANGTDYGLVATVWTREMGRGKRLAHAIRAGYVNIRTSGAEGPAPGYALSHEPQKASGFGVEFGLRGLQAYSTLKAIAFNGA